MVKEKKSFFERLTGSVRLDEEQAEMPEEREGRKELRKSSSASSQNWIEEEEKEGELTIDVYQTPEMIVIKTMIAGVRPEDLDISITRDMVTIKGRREEEKTVRKGLMSKLIACLLLAAIATPVLAIPSSVSVTVSPTSFTVAPGGDKRIAVHVTGTSNTAVVWLVNGIVGGNSTVGTIDSTGKYVAPIVPPAKSMVTIKAVSVASTQSSATCIATIGSPQIPAVPTISSVVPTQVIVGPISLTVNGAKFIMRAKTCFRIYFAQIGVRITALEEEQMPIISNVPKHLERVWVWLAFPCPWLKTNSNLLNGESPLLVDFPGEQFVTATYPWVC